MTGRKGKWITEFGVPDDYEEYCEWGWRTLRVRVEIEACEEDLQSWGALCALKGFKNLWGSSTQGEAADPDDALPLHNLMKTPDQKVAEEIEELKNDTPTPLQRFNNQSITLKLIRTKCESSLDVDMMSSFVKALTAAITKTEKVFSLFNNLLVKSVDESMMPKLIELIHETDTRFGSMLQWANKFDVNVKDM